MTFVGDREDPVRRLDAALGVEPVAVPGPTMPTDVRLRYVEHVPDEVLARRCPRDHPRADEIQTTGGTAGP